MKTLALLSIVGALFGVGQPTLAQVTGIEPMSGLQQLGVCGGCLTILAIVMLRTLPGMARLHADAIREAATTNAEAIKEAAIASAAGTEKLADVLRAGQDSQIAFLREVIDK